MKFGPHARLAVGRMKTGAANNMELAYGQELELRKRVGEILWYRFEGLKLRLADNTFYTPDYAVMLADGTMELHEIKGGFWADDARVKIKVAAEMYPFRFVGLTSLPKKKGGGWKIEDFSTPQGGV